MMRVNPVFCGVVACALLVCAAAPARAQVERRQRPQHGIFGGPEASPNSPQQLDISASFFGAYDDDVTADTPGLQGTAAGLGGMYSGLTTGLSYNRRIGRRAAFNSSAGTSFRYYPDLKGQSLAPLGEQVGAGFTIGSEKNDRNRLSFGGDLGFAPYYALGLAPIASVPMDIGDLAPQPVDSIVVRREALMYGTGVQFEHALSARSTVTLNYAYHVMDFHEESRRQTSQSGGVHYRHGLSKNVGVKIGYERADSNFGGTNDHVANHIIDAGLDFTRPLSLTRRTTLTFSIGPSLIEQNNVLQYRAVIDAAVSHEIGRTWAARATYHRGFGMVAGLNSMVYSDGAGAALEGLLTRRLDFAAMGSFSTGEFTMTGAPNNYNTYQGSVRLRAALQQSTAVFVEYVAYRYQFDSRLGLPLGVPGSLVRQGVRTGLSLWLPLIR